MAPVYAQMTRLAWRNVRRNWRHSLATVLAIASGFMAVSLFDGFIKELQDRSVDGFSTRGMMGQVLIQKQDASENSSEDQWLYSLDSAEQKFLEDFFAKDPAFVRRVRFLVMAGMVTAGPTSTVFAGIGYDLKDGLAMRGQRWYWNMVAGLPMDQAKVSSVAFGMGLGHLIGCESTYQGPSFILEDGNYKAENRPFQCQFPRVTLSVTTEASQVNAIDYPVIGFFDEGFREADKRAANLDLKDAQRLLDTDKITLVSVQLHSDDQVPEFIGRLQAAARAQNLALDVLPWQKHRLAQVVANGMQILSVFRNLFMAIVVTIGVMSVANTMMKSVNERVREIGTLRSIGFLRRHLVWMFSLEGFFLSLIACGLGLLGTLALSALIGWMGFSYRAGILSVPIVLKVRYAPLAWVISALVLTLLATGTAWFCSRRATRLVIADAMRHV